MVTRFLCAACERLAPAASFSIDAGQLRLVCSRCRVSSVLEVDAAVPLAAAAPSRVVPLRAVDDAVSIAREAARSRDPFEIPADHCPKCIAQRNPEATSCPACGLTFVNYLPAETAPSAELVPLLHAALERWNVPAAHERLLALASRRGELAQVGRFYRLRLVAAPLDPVAQRGLDEVLRMASLTASLTVRDSPVEKAPLRRLGVLGFFVLVTAVGLVILAMLLTRGE